MVSRQKFQKIMKKYSLGLWAVSKGLRHHGKSSHTAALRSFEKSTARSLNLLRSVNYVSGFDQCVHCIIVYVLHFPSQQ